jgi:hypothetical protein
VIRNVSVSLLRQCGRSEIEEKDEPPSNIHSSNRVLYREPFEDWYGMSNTVSRVEDDSCCSARGVAVRWMHKMTHLVSLFIKKFDREGTKGSKRTEQESPARSCTSPVR